jgi:hypothetical protein
VGNRLIYSNTYEEALEALSQPGGSETGTQSSAQQNQPPGPAPQPLQTSAPKSSDPRIQVIREHLQRYRDLASQGKWAEAGRELEAIQNEVQK